MSRDKQIEEMAREIPKVNCIHEPCAECKWCGCANDEAYCTDYLIAEHLYNTGYRKASDVALEAVDDFQIRLRNIFCTMCNDNDYNTVCLLEIDSAIECLFDVFVAELKKKYTEGEG